MERLGKLIRRSAKAYKSHWIGNIVVVFLVNVIIGGYALSSSGFLHSIQPSYEPIKNEALSKIEDKINIDDRLVNRDTLPSLLEDCKPVIQKVRGSYREPSTTGASLRQPSTR